MWSRTVIERAAINRRYLKMSVSHLSFAFLSSSRWVFPLWAMATCSLRPTWAASSLSPASPSASSSMACLSPSFTTSSLTTTPSSSPRSTPLSPRLAGRCISPGGPQRGWPSAAKTSLSRELPPTVSKAENQNVFMWLYWRIFLTLQQETLLPI